LTEAEWLTGSQPDAMLTFVETFASQRKLRLFAVTCARDLLEHHPEPDVRGDFGDMQGFAAAILRAEAHADGRGSLQNAFWVERPEAAWAAWVVFGMDADVGFFINDQAATVAAAIKHFRVPPSHWLHDIFGNPFRPVPMNPSWRKSPIPEIAHSIYEESRFEGMPILADALEDAGCTNEQILAHCREHQPHARGCFVLDLLMGRS
jgi:hypothetical protein